MVLKITSAKILDPIPVPIPIIKPSVFEEPKVLKTKRIEVGTPPPKVVDKTKKMVFYQKSKDRRFKRCIRNLLPV